jgi:hypothetical protein
MGSIEILLSSATLMTYSLFFVEAYKSYKDDSER